MTEIKWNTFLPSQFTTVIHEGDWEWVAKTLCNSDGKLKDYVEDNSSCECNKVVSAFLIVFAGEAILCSNFFCFSLFLDVLFLS